MQIFNNGDCDIQASILIKRKSHVEIEDVEGKKLLGMYPKLQCTPSAIKVNALEVENAELKLQVEKLKEPKIEEPKIEEPKVEEPKVIYHKKSTSKKKR